MVKPNVTGAHYGLRDWLMQRITAVVMVVYSLVLLGCLVTHKPGSYEAWRAIFTPQWMKLFSMMFLLSLFLHAWVGVRDILMDYIKPAGLRLALLSLVIVLLVAYASWGAQILWSL